MIENCKNCAFGVYSGIRHCRKRAPIVYIGVVSTTLEPTGGEGSLCIVHENKGEITAWPRVEDHDFCGEFELKDAQ
ncbi:hypothetical protein JEY40_24720 [Bradyrhizobium japonicum]|uniref:hypothetical protein n=1 Tax=Bradyrhizobium japonicum TaxID=375 RepID=UPI00200C53A0|nr:hypothetical protein [Bradyrhizobium japonicum]UQD69223.1 hypothetical protein JEY40_24720 [Bradyrhizobium japonicum]WAX24485.1 hypothetical protein [Bradyrhizobium phage ppBjS10J-1]